ncbi:MAG: hypothetical protein R2860_03645 [Desulfobacterales bacterium]
MQEFPDRFVVVDASADPLEVKKIFYGTLKKLHTPDTSLSA